MNRNYTSGQGGIVGRLRTGKGILHITECYGKYNKTTEGRHGNMKPMDRQKTMGNIARMHITEDYEKAETESRLGSRQKAK
tara:strand:- start:38 stop:280 length:243 start_codon:yes stop_codon:yes gene_type:complete